MSSAPMTNGGSLAGVRVVGCPNNSLVSSALNPSGESEVSPQATEISAPQEPRISIDSSSTPADDSQFHSIESPAPSPTKVDPAPSDEMLTDQAEGNSAVAYRADAKATATSRVDSHTTNRDNGMDRRKSENRGDTEANETALRFHRIREVRVEQGVSPRSMARRLNMDVRSYKRLEDPTEDLPLSTLHQIQQTLEVPLCDLLVQTEGLSRPVEERAKMVKTMKTAVAIREAKGNSRIQRLADMLCEQLVELMPELKDVGGWPQFGARRGKSALGRALSEPIDMSQLRSED